MMPQVWCLPAEIWLNLVPLNLNLEGKRGFPCHMPSSQASHLLFLVVPPALGFLCLLDDAAVVFFTSRDLAELQAFHLGEASGGLAVVVFPPGHRLA